MNASEYSWLFHAPGRRAGPEVIEAAWQEYHTTHSECARETLVQRYIHLVRYMAGQLGRSLPPSVDNDDLVSAGAVGFLGALDSFDPAVGTDFSVYALTRIRGAIIDFTRELDPVGRVTRRRLREVARALARLEQKLGRQPSDAETAHQLGLSIDAYHTLMACGAATMTLWLEDVESGDGENGRTSRARIPDISMKDPLTSLVDKEIEERLAALVARLPRVQQLVLHLHYVEELNFREVAMLLDVSESRVNQVHSAALLALRARMQHPAFARVA